MKQKIKLLDDQTINKIAAGEVIERPSSVVKELVDNSIDAHASKIIIDYQDGGKKAIVVTDNGVGISVEDLPLTVIRHATSKITQLEDLQTLTSMGFRGEALSSISHVAKVHITSKPETALAHELIIDNGTLSGPHPASAPQGTKISINHLFSNVPVRHKFLKSASRESFYIHELVKQFCLSHPTIDFRLRHNDKELLNTTGITTLEGLLVTFFGNALKESLIHIHDHTNILSVSGYMSNPTLTYSNKQKQYIYINNRRVNSPLIQKLIHDIYFDIIESRRHPLIVLNIHIPPQLLDINIHPQKKEVKFLNPGQVYDTLAQLLKPHFSKQHRIHTLGEAPYPSSALKPTETVSQPLAWTQPQAYHATETIASLFSAETQGQNVATQHFQIFNLYIVINAHDAIWILDQHAVHERILYEKIKKEKAETVVKQQLLISDVITLNESEMALFREHKIQFSDLFFDVEEFGKNELIVRQVPAQFMGISLNRFIQDFIHRLCEFSVTDTPIPEHKERYQMMACKAAIKAGKVLTDLEIKQLVSDFITSPQNFTCPHGRPLAIQITQKDLETLFHRR